MVRTRAAKPSRHRGLLIECCPYHEELFPAWLHMAEDAGCRLDIAALPGASQQQMVERARVAGSAPLRIYDATQLDRVPWDDYAFVLLASLIHAGYGFQQPLLADLFGFDAAAPLPDLELLARLDKPSLAIIHEPKAWIEHLPDACFELDSAGTERGFLRLFSSRRWYCDCVDLRADRDTRWHQRFGDFERRPGDLVLDEAGTRRELVTDDDGQTYLGRDGLRLRRIAYRRPDLAAHLGRGRHAVAALSDAGRGYLRAAFPQAHQLVPFEIARDLPRLAKAPTDIVFAAAIDPRRKTMDALVDAVAATDQPVVVVGGSREPGFDDNPWVASFRRHIAERHLDHRFHFTGHLDHLAFRDRVRGARFLLPLVDDQVDGGAYQTKPPAALLWSLCFGVPLIVDDSIARRLGIEGAITYSGDDLAAGFERARRIGDDEYEDMCLRIARQARRLRHDNRQTFTEIVTRLVGRAAEGKFV